MHAGPYPLQASTPERLIAGSGAGLAFWIARGRFCLIVLKGSEYMPVFFQGANRGYDGGL